MSRMYVPILLAPLIIASKDPPTVQAWQTEIDIVRESDQTNSLNFDASSLPRLQGHDVYYRSTEPLSEQNDRRINKVL